ncbi:MAG: helix-turn-helix domain-containing protein [Firmicutes bacterium]|nr:helix-turn-helix domain-containing protein [Bacillota bacterium]
MNNSNNTGEFLKSLRISKGLTQMELAEYLNVSNKTVSKWENGLGIPEVSTLVILADFYDVSVDDILRGTKRTSKNPEKEANISNYIVSKIKNNYINLLIVSIGIWLLSNVTIIVLGEMTTNSSLGMGVGVIIIVIGLIIQGININYLRLQIKEIDLKEKNNLLNLVFHTSYIFIYLSISTVIFAGLYNVGSSVVLKLDFVFYRFIYSYLLTAVRAIIIYYIIRIFKISFLNKLSIRGSILNGILLVVIFVPFMIITISDPYELAIKTDNSYVSYSTYNKDEDTDRYYQLKYLSLLGSQQNADDNLVYDEDTYEFIYTFDDGYELVMSNETYSFIITLEYVKFEFDDDYAVGYMFDLSRTEMDMVLYSNFTTPLLSLYVIGCLVYYFVLKERKYRSNKL